MKKSYFAENNGTKIFSDSLKDLEKKMSTFEDKCWKVFKIAEVPKDFEEFYSQEIDGKKYFSKFLNVYCTKKYKPLWKEYDDMINDLLSQIFKFSDTFDNNEKPTFNPEYIDALILLLKKMEKDKNLIQKELETL